MILRNPQALYILRNLEKFENSIKLNFFICEITANFNKSKKITPKLFQAHQSVKKWWKFWHLNRYCYLKSLKGEIVSYIKKKSPEKQATENHVGWPFNSELGSKNARSWSSPKGFKNCFWNAPINYRQTMPDDRFTLVKMNITRSWIHDYEWHCCNMSFKCKPWILTN